MRPTVKDAAVIFVDGDGKFTPGVIDEVFTPGAARIALGHGTVQASYSETGAPGTFHYKDQSGAVKEASAAAAKKQPQPIIAAPVSGPASSQSGK